MSSSKLPADFDASQVTIAHLRDPKNKKWFDAMSAHVAKGYPLKKYLFDPAKAKLDQDGNPIKFDAINFEEPHLTNIFRVSNTDIFPKDVFHAIKYGLPQNPPNEGISKAAKEAMDRANQGTHPGNEATEATLGKPTIQIQNGLRTLVTQTVDQCADQIADAFRDQLRSKLTKGMSTLLGKLTPQEAGERMVTAMFNSKAPTVSAATGVSEVFLLAMKPPTVTPPTVTPLTFTPAFISVKDDEDNSPTNISTTPTSPRSWASVVSVDNQEDHLPSDLLDEGI